MVDLEVSNMAWCDYESQDAAPKVVQNCKIAVYINTGVSLSDLKHRMEVKPDPLTESMPVTISYYFWNCPSCT